ERGTDDVADLAGAGGDVLEGAPAAGEQGEAAFALAAQRPLDGVAGASADVEFPAAGRLFHRNVHADARAVISQVGQGGQAGGGGVVEGGQGVDTGGGEVMHRARLHLGDPQREPAWGGHG